MKKLFLYSFALLGLAGSAAAQSAPAHRTCVSFEHLQQQMAADPAMAAARQQQEVFTRQFEQHASLVNGKTTQVIYNIPVVVHVLYNSTATNISDAQVLSQITVLNQDYQLLNADNSSVPSAFSSLKADCQISFCMAQRDPNGAATTGIVRKSTTKSDFSSSTDDAKHSTTGGDDAWPRDQYLNLWVVPGIDGGGVLGYAQFPGGTAATDGVVIGYNFFGNTGTVSSPYNKGRTATHEIGHWLNLYHIWGDDGGACTGSDNVGDTPNQASENYGTPAFPHVTCSNGPNGDMFMDYMDYTDDASMYMFSTGQKTRMQAVLASGGARATLNTSLGCTAPAATCGAPAGLAAGSLTSSSAALSWTAVSGASGYTLQYKTSAATTWTSVTAASNSYALSGLAASTTYNWKVATNCSGTASAYTTGSNFATTAATTGCGAPTSSFSVTNITATSAKINWGAVSGATSYTLQYKPSTASTWTTVSGITTNYYSATTLSPATAYSWHVATLCSNTLSSYSATNSFTTASGTTCTNSYEPNNSVSAAVAITTNTSIASLVGTATDKDYYKVVTTSNQPKLKVTLTNLSYDYDVQLLNSSGTQLGISQNGSTTNETITYNTAIAGATYYVYVYGYNGAYSATSCYTLTTLTSSSNLKEEAPDPMASEKQNLVFMPNPTHGDVKFNLFAYEKSQAAVQVMDQNGRLVYSSQIELQEGQNTGELHLGDLAAGLYFVRLQNGETVKTAKLLLQK